MLKRDAGTLTSRFTELVVASEEVGGGQTAADVKDEETQFPALRQNFLMQTHFFFELGDANDHGQGYGSSHIKSMLPLGSHSGS